MAQPHEPSILGKTICRADASQNLRFEAPNMLLRHGISCAIWGEDALLYYGVRTVCFDLFLLVQDSEEAAECLENAEYSRAPSNPRYEFIPELYVLPRFKKVPSSEEETPGAICVALLQAERCRYILPPACASKDLIPPLPQLIDSIIDAWLDATTVDYAMHLAMHLLYLQDYCPKARDPLFSNDLKPEHREYYLRSLWYESIQAEREKWKLVRDSFPAAT